MTEITINLSGDQVYFLSIVIIAMEIISLFVFIEGPMPLNKDVWRLNVKCTCKIKKICLKSVFEYAVCTSLNCEIKVQMPQLN